MSKKNGKQTADEPKVDGQVVTFETDFNGTAPAEALDLSVEKSRSGKVRKASQQDEEKEFTTRSYVEPRISFDKQLDFYDYNVWHKRCVLLKASVIAGLGWDLVTDEEDKDPDQDYKKIKQLLDNPNNKPDESFSETCFRMLVDYGATGNAFLETPRNLKGEIVELYHARAATVRRDKDIRNGGYWQGTNLQQKKNHFANFGSPFKGTDENEMLHYYRYDPKSDYYGIGDWFPALADMLMDRNIAEYYINLFDNQLTARFAVLVEGGKLSDKALKSIKNFIKNKHSGIDNAGGTLYLNSESKDVRIKIEKLSVDFSEDNNGNTNLRNQARDTVIAAHGVPPRMVGVMEAGQLGGGGEVSGQLHSWKENDINPRQSNFEAFLNNTILDSFGDHKWKLKFREMDVTDIITDAKFWQRALDPRKGWANREEAREFFNLPAEEEDDNQQQQIQKMMDQLPNIYQQVSGWRKLLETADTFHQEL